MKNQNARVARDKGERLQSRIYLVLGLVVGFVGLVLLAVVPMLGVLMAIMGLAFVIAGSRISQRWRCTACGNRTDPKALRCATCGAVFSGSR